MRRATVIPLALTLLVISGCRENGAADPLRFRGNAMGTTWQVTIADAEATSDASDLQQQIAQVIERVEAEMSHWRPGSVVSQFNRSRSTEPLPISNGLAAVLTEAQRVRQLSGEALDVTIGPLVDLWGFGPKGRRDGLPSPEQIEQARTHVKGDRLIVIWAEGATPSLRKLDPELVLDLSAVVEGFTIDQVAAWLEGQGFRRYLIEIGGELRARGASEKGKAWRIGLEQPDPQAVGLIRRTIELRDAAVATSGSYRHFFREQGKAGKTYSHILDPRTGRPIEHRLASVSVIDDLAMRADALATALMVLGPDDGFALATREGIAATFVEMTPAGWVERSTPRFLERAR